jgi:hypothetical protein
MKERPVPEVALASISVGATAGSVGVMGGSVSGFGTIVVQVKRASRAAQPARVR